MMLFRYYITFGTFLGAEASGVTSAACTAPTVALISPYNTPTEGWGVHGSIAFAVDAKDTNGISYVDFYVDGVHQSQDSDYPYGILWNTRSLTANRNYTLLATATNSCGMTTSVTHDVTVLPPLVKKAVTGSVVTSGLLPNISVAIEGINMRDTTVALGPDNTYYLSGTGSDNDAWQHNEGINLWKSSDLKSWTYVGLVWSFERDGYPDEKAWWTLEGHAYRGVWAPEFQYINSNFYITYSLATKGTKLLKSSNGKPEGPYVLAHGTEATLYNNIDGGLFTGYDSPTDGYLCYLGGNVFKLNEGWNATSGSVTRIDIGLEGCFVVHAQNKYYMSTAVFMSGSGRYSSWVGISDNALGPYTQQHEAIPCGGHNTYFHDACGTLWGTFFGNDKSAPWIEKPAIVKMAFKADGTLHPDPDQTVPDCAAGV